MSHSSSLSPTQQAVLAAINRHGQITSSQVRRLFYTGTKDGMRVRCQRHLARLYRLGLVRRVWTVYADRPAEYLYMPQGTTTRGAVMHTLDITELYVRLSEANKNKQSTYSTSETESRTIFDREPWSHHQVGRLTLKPDAFLDLGDGRKAFIEVDRGTERRPQLAKQMRQYVRAYEHEWDTERDGEHFPQVIWTVPDPDRRRIVQGVVKQQSTPSIFRVVLFDDFVSSVT